MSMQTRTVRTLRAPAKTGYSNRLYNPDLASQLKNKRQTGTWRRVFTFWMTDVHSVSTYVFAASLFALGLRSWQLIVSMFIGVALVQLSSNLLAKPGQVTGVPFPVVARLSFGVYGAQVPLLVRSLLASVWFGVQTYVASTALNVVWLRLWPNLAAYASGEHAFLGLSALGWFSFLWLWALQIVLFWNGTLHLRRVSAWAGPAVFAVMLGLAGWVVWKAGFGAFALHLRDEARPLSAGTTLWQMTVAVALVVAYFGLSMLRAGDCARDCESYTAVKRGNAWGLMLGFLFFSAVMAVTTAGTRPIFGQLAHGPADILMRVDSTFAAVLGALILVAATLSANMLTNSVAAALDIGALAQNQINRRGGRVIAALGGLLITPWNLFASAEAFHTTLDLLGALMGPLAAIVIVDFYGVKKQQVKLDALYSDSREGRYWYEQGVHRHAVTACVPAAAIGCALSLLPHCLGAPGLLRELAHFAWLIALVLAGVTYRLIAAQEEPLVLPPSQVIRVRQVL